MTANDVFVVVLGLGFGSLACSARSFLWYRGSEDPLYQGFYRTWPIFLKIGIVLVTLGFLGVAIF